MIYTIQLNRRFRVLGYLTSFTYQKTNKKKQNQKQKNKKKVANAKAQELNYLLALTLFSYYIQGKYHKIAVGICNGRVICLNNNNNN